MPDRIRPLCNPRKDHMSTANTDPHVLTVEEAADFLRVGRSAAYEAVRRGEIPSVRIGRSIRIPRHRLEEMIGAQPFTPFDAQNGQDAARAREDDPAFANGLQPSATPLRKRGSAPTPDLISDDQAAA